jgi:hypothetical protein
VGTRRLREEGVLTNNRWAGLRGIYKKEGPGKLAGRGRGRVEWKMEDGKWKKVGKCGIRNAELGMKARDRR